MTYKAPFSQQGDGIGLTKSAPEPSRKHFFRDADDNRTVVITTLLPNGEYGAYREGEDGGQCRGFGHSRLAAIADLQQWIEDNEEAQDPRWTY